MEYDNGINEFTLKDKETRNFISVVKELDELIDSPESELEFSNEFELLIAVMLSPVFGFTVDELAQIRLVNKKTELFVCLQKYAEGNDKAKAFLKKIE